MKNEINYFYNIYPKQILKKDDSYYFDYHHSHYMFIPFKRDLKDQNLIFNFNHILKGRGVLTHDIIINNNKQILTIIDNNIPYILLKIQVDCDKIINIWDLIEFQKRAIITSAYFEPTDWSILWGQKIDYFEYQMNQLGKKYPELYNSFSYFVGLAENAISYVKDTIIEQNPTPYDYIVVSHKRVKGDMKCFDFFNPLEYIKDYQVRDLSEYLKSIFWLGKNPIKDLDIYLKNIYLTPYSLRLLYGRLLFPSFYFDLFSEIIEGREPEALITKFIDGINKYETFLYEVNNYINKYTPIPVVNWINKKNYKKL